MQNRSFACFRESCLIENKEKLWVSFNFINIFFEIYFRTQDGESSLQLAIKRHLPVVVDALCKRGANMNIWDDAGDCALWQALESGQEDIASILVSRYT